MTRNRRRPVSVESLESRGYLSAAITFAPHVEVPAGTAPVAVAAADFNADGDQDLVSVDNTTQKANVLFGNGTGGFTGGPVLSLTTPPVAVVVGDFNGDGKPDVAVAGSPGNANGGTTVTIFLATGPGTFGLGQVTTVETGVGTNEPVALATGDFNGDGKLDVAVTEYSNGAVAILTGTGNGAFAAPALYNAGTLPTAITAADFNGDGRPDLAVTNTLVTSGNQSDNVSILIGDGGGTFSAGQNISINASGSTAVTAADFNGDGKPDLIVGNAGGTATVLVNSGGTFTAGAMPQLAGGSTGVAAADFNLDGFADFISVDGGTAFSSGANSVSVVPGAGDAAVGASTDFDTGSMPQGLAVADFNNDGKPDVAVADEGSGTIGILLNSTAVTPITTTVVLTLSPATTPAGSPVDLTATLTPSSVSPVTGEKLPTGTVDLYDGTTLLGTTTLAGGATAAAFGTTALVVGTHHLSARYRGDTAYAPGASPAVVETITPSAASSPHLVGTLVTDSLPTTAAPGESGVLRVRVTNTGNVTATGILRNTLYLSTDASPDANATAVMIKGSLASARLNLRPDHSVVLTGSFTVPAGQAMGIYSPLVDIDPAGVFAPAASNNFVVGPATSIVDEFGTVGGRPNVPLVFPGVGDAVVTARLTGPGTGTIDDSAAATGVTLTGTTARTVVTVTTTPGGHGQVGSVTALSPVGSIRASALDVTGVVDLPGGIAAVQFASATGATFDIGGGPAAVLDLGTVTGTSLTAAGGIKLLSVNRWTNTAVDLLTAAWIGSIASRGDFGPSITLSGIGAPGGAAVGSATIAAAIGPGTWAITGGVERLAVGSIPAGWTGTIAGPIGSFTVNGPMAGVATASKFSSVVIRGDFTGRIIAPALPKKVRVGGVLVDPTVDPRFEM